MMYTDKDYPMFCSLMSMHLELKELGKTRSGLKKIVENVEAKLSWKISVRYF